MCSKTTVAPKDTDEIIRFACTNTRTPAEIIVEQSHKIIRTPYQADLADHTYCL